MSLFKIPLIIVLLVLLYAPDRGLLLGFLEEDFQDHGWCLYLVIVWGFKSKRTKQGVSFWELFEASKGKGINNDENNYGRQNMHQKPLQY